MSLTTRLASGGRTRDIAVRGNSGVRAPQVATDNVSYTGRDLPQVPNWDARSAVEQGYLGHPAVYSAVRTIAETVASLPFRAGKNPEKPGSYDTNAPLARLLGPAPGGPNPTTSSRALWAWSIAQRIVTGRFGWELERAPRTKQIVNVWPLVSQYLQPIPTVVTPGQKRPTTYFDKYRYNLPTGFVDLDATQVFYSWRPSQSDWRQAETVMQAARIPISIALALNRYHWGMLNNGMSGRKLIVTPPFAEPDQRRAWQEQFLAEMTGFDNAGKPAFGEATADFDPTTGKSAPPSIQVIDLAQTSTDAQLMALMEYVEAAIYKAFSVPESEIGDASRRTYSNAGEEYRVFWTRTIVPLLAEIKDDINTYLAPQLGDEVGWFDLSGVDVLKPSATFQPDTPGNLITAGVVVPGEIREDLGLPFDLPTGPDQENAPLPEPAADDPEIAPTVHGPSGRSAEPGTRTAAGTAPALTHPAIDRVTDLVRRRAGTRDDGNIAPTAAMVALFVPAKVAAKLAVPGGVPAGDMHVTLAFLGKDLTPDQAKTARTVTAAVAAQHQPLTGTIGGLGHFPAGDDGTPYYAPVDVPGLERLREAVVTQLADAGVPVSTDHGFTPHMTLTYVAGDGPAPDPVPATPVEFGELGLAVGPKRTTYPLGGMRHAVIDRIDAIVARREATKAGARVDEGAAGDYKARHLIEWFNAGAGGKIDWGGPGDLTACHAVASLHMDPDKAWGFCQNRHEDVLGKPNSPKDDRAVAMAGETGPVLITGPAIVHPYRDIAVETEAGSAGLLLPKAPTRLPKPIMAHVYRPSKTDRRKCATCGKGVTASGHLHTATPGVRHRGPHLPVTGGHANTPERARQAVRKTVDRHVTTLESQMETVLHKLFADQRKATVSRMVGNRGRQMIKAALRAAGDPQPQQHEPTPLIDPTHIFDQTHWTDRTVQDIQSIMTAIGSWVPGHFATHTPGVADVDDDTAAAQSVTDLLGQATNRIAGQITDETFSQLQKALTDGVVAGDGYSGLATRVKAVFDEADTVRAERISRTEVQSAVNGASDSYAANLPEGIIGAREWLCVAAGTPVASAKPLQIVERRRSAGFMTSLRTEHGRLLSVTPNHPVLTDRGWVAAHSLNVGDNLICHSRVQTADDATTNTGPAHRTDPDVENVPPRIDEVFRAAALKRAEARMVFVVPDLYSDPIDCEVEVVPIDGDLAADLQAPFGEPAGQRVLELTDEALHILACAGSSDAHIGTSPECAVSTSGFDAPHSAGSLCVGIAPSNEHSGLRMVAPGDSSTLQLVVDGDRAAAEFSGDVCCSDSSKVIGNHRVAVNVESPSCDSETLRGTCLLDGGRIAVEPQAGGICRRSKRDAAGSKSPHDCRAGCAESARDLAGTFPSEITIDNIVDIETSWVSTDHEVYDLVTENGWFVADGIVVHNSTPDERTRPAHRAADGQEKPMGQPFEVGGAELMFPADPAGPPDQTVNCRCVLLYTPASKG